MWVCFLLLFIIGFEMNMKRMLKQGQTIFRSSAIIICLEAIAGGFLLKAFFGQGWYVSLLIAFSFATVREAVLAPILDEFKMINTKLGQMLIGLGTVDDLVEIVALVMVVTLVDFGGTKYIVSVLVALGLLILLTLGIWQLDRNPEGKKFTFHQIETVFLFVLAILFLYVGIGKWADATSLGALLAGVAVRNILLKSRLRLIESELKAVCYGLFAPIFFVWVTLSLNFSLLVKNWVVIVVLMLISAS